MEAIRLKRNRKQGEFFNTVIKNTADFHDKEQGKYSRGFSATLQAGRGFGKTFEIFDLTAACAKSLPGAIFGLVSNTYYQVQTIVLQQFEMVMKEHELTKYDAETNPLGQFVIFKTPPKHFKKPIFSVQDYTRTISFVNGFALQLGSADRPETLRGINWDGLFADETRSCTTEFKKVLYPGIRANKYAFKDPRPGREGYNHPLHWLICEFSSAPDSPEGMHVYNNEELMKTDSEGYFFMSGTAYDNLRFLPGNYISTLRNSLTPIEFDIEVMNYRMTSVSNKFYPSLNTTNTFGGYEYVWNSTDQVYDITTKASVSDKALILGFDFNSRFTSLVVAQHLTKEFKFVDCLWVKESTTNLVDALMDKFTDEYKEHGFKKVFIRGDNSGKKKPESSEESCYEIIERKLKVAGWRVVKQLQDTYPAHADRYIIVNSLLVQENKTLPQIKIHEAKCKYLLISLRMAPADAKFKKNKDSEKSKYLPQEEATHFSDIFDYILCYSFGSSVVKSTKRNFGFDVLT